MKPILDDKEGWKRARAHACRVSSLPILAVVAAMAAKDVENSELWKKFGYDLGQRKCRSLAAGL